MCSPFLYSPSHTTHSSASLLSFTALLLLLTILATSAHSFSHVSFLLHIYRPQGRPNTVSLSGPPENAWNTPTDSQAKKGALAAAPHSCTKSSSGRLSSVIPSAHLQASQAAIVEPLDGVSKLYVTSPPILKRKGGSSSLRDCSSHCLLHSCTPRQFWISTHLHEISKFLDTLNAACGSVYCPKLTA